MKAANLSQKLTPAQMSSPISIKETSTKILIYADGSCLKNGSDSAQAGAGVVIMTEDQKRIKLKACYLGALTNQKAEIQEKCRWSGIAQTSLPRADFFRLEICHRNDAWT